MCDRNAVNSPTEETTYKKLQPQLSVLSLKKLKYNIRHCRELPLEKLILLILKAVKMAFLGYPNKWS